MTGKGWVAKSLAQPMLMVDGQVYDLARNMQTVEYLPGKLVQVIKDSRLKFETELCFSTSRTAFVRSVITNLSDKPLNLSLVWQGGVFEKQLSLRQMARKCLSIIRFTHAVEEKLKLIFLMR